MGFADIGSPKDGVAISRSVSFCIPQTSRALVRRIQQGTAVLPCLTALPDDEEARTKEILSLWIHDCFSQTRATCARHLLLAKARRSSTSVHTSTRYGISFFFSSRV